MSNVRYMIRPVDNKLQFSNKGKPEVFEDKIKEELDERDINVMAEALFNSSPDVMELTLTTIINGHFKSANANYTNLLKAIIEQMILKGHLASFNKLASSFGGVEMIHGVLIGKEESGNAAALYKHCFDKNSKLIADRILELTKKSHDALYDQASVVKDKSPKSVTSTKSTKSSTAKTSQKLDMAKKDKKEAKKPAPAKEEAKPTPVATKTKEKLAVKPVDFKEKHKEVLEELPSGLTRHHISSNPGVDLATSETRRAKAVKKVEQTEEFKKLGKF